MNRKNLAKLITFGLLLVSLYLITYTKHQIEDDNFLHVKVYDVGQGDAIFIKSPNDKYMLIDGGPDSRALGLMIKDLPPGPCNLVVVVLTHPHFDHLNGLNDVLSYCSVNLVVTTRRETSTKVFEKWQKLLADGKTSGRIKDIRYVKALDSFGFDGLVFTVLWPKNYAYLKSITNENLASIVLFLRYKDFDFLLTGDAEKEVFDELLLDNGSLGSMGIDVFKVPHHGSSDSLNGRFVDSIMPKVSIISVGEGNKYRHPSGSVINYLEGLGSHVYRTDKDGTVEIVSDGSRFEIKSSQ